jgi:hypothetical protein
MKLQTGLVLSSLLSLGLLSYACANGDSVNNGSSGNGGSNNTGGSSNGNSGGSTGSGNNNGNTGGSTGSGNNNGTGGVKNTGGSTGLGNTNGNTGGATGVGNTSGNTGGTTGGSTGVGGNSNVSCGSSFSVAANGFVTVPAVGGGCWSGFASDGGDAGSMIKPGTFAMCGTPCGLTMTGTLNASTMTNSYAGYAYLGFNIGQDPSGPTNTPVAPKGSGITVTFTNGSSSTIRVALNADATGTTSWCSTVTASPATIPYSSFTQQCYNATPGPAYTKQPIVSIQLSVPGGATSGPVNVTLVSVTENP